SEGEYLRCGNVHGYREEGTVIGPGVVEPGRGGGDEQPWVRAVDHTHARGLGRGQGNHALQGPVGTVAVHPSGAPDRDPQVCLRVYLHAVGVSLVDPGEDGPCHGFTGGRHLVGIDPALGAVGEVHACTVRGERGAVGDGVFVQDPCDLAIGVGAVDRPRAGGSVV